MKTLQKGLFACLAAAALLFAQSVAALERPHTPAEKAEAFTGAKQRTTDTQPEAEADEAKTPVQRLEKFKKIKMNILDLKCADCHAVIKGEKTRPEHDHGKCESCHTTETEHRQALIKGESPKGTMAMPKSKECSSCHKTDKKLMNWKFSAHSKAGGECTDCHAMHVSPLAKSPNLTASKMDKNSAMCVKCHQDVASAQNMRSHHPVKEGAMSCVSCHDVHGGAQTMLKSKNEQCLSCHQALRGPKVYEHAPVAEDCMSCHAPHGSSSRRLLTVSQPAVCLQCHSIAQGKHGYSSTSGFTEPAPNLTDPANRRTISGAVLRGCTNCHGAIHGSHQDPLLRY
jgi:DmsE family decaheme c-type cytochrome